MKEKEVFGLPFDSVNLNDDEMLVIKGGLSGCMVEEAGCECEAGAGCGCGCRKDTTTVEQKKCTCGTKKRRRKNR